MRKVLIPAIVLCAAIVCPLMAAKASAQSLPEETFEEFWAIYQDGYALFGVKRIDWDAVYDIYRPQVTADTTGDELFAVLSEMGGLMNDIHVVLRDREGGRFFRSGARSIATGDFDDGRFSLDLIDSAYAGAGLSTLADGNFSYGRLAGNVGYVHFSSFADAEASAEAMDGILAALADVSAFIIDVRQNGGGDDRAGQAIASRFADQRRLYMSVQNRNIMEARDSFAEPVDWYLEPAGPSPFTGPVILLTDSRSISAAENFALAMRALPHAAIVGETTAGVFADAGTVPLPNGWEVGVPINIFRDPQGFCWEGLGIPPDYHVVNARGDIEAGRDAILDFALDLAATGAVGNPAGAVQPPRNVAVTD